MRELIKPGDTVYTKGSYPRPFLVTDVRKAKDFPHDKGAEDLICVVRHPELYPNYNSLQQWQKNAGMQWSPSRVIKFQLELNL